jgi:hypothetical protein
MSALDLTVFDPMLKDHYSDKEVPKLAFQKNTALGLVKKSNKKMVGGRKWVQPFGYALPGGGSSSFSVAITNANANTSLYEAWEVTRTKHYRLGKVDNETIEATATGDMDAFEPAFDEFDRVIQAEGNYLNYRFFRSKSGSAGKMNNASVAVAIATLTDPADVWGWRKDEVAQLSAAADGTGLKAGTLTVASVQRQLGTITFTGNISAGVGTAAVGDYLYLNGDATLAAAGLADWVPDSAPTSTPFYGVDRTLEPDFLGGVRIDATDGRSIANALVDAVAAVQNLGGDPDVVFMSTVTFGTLSKQLEGKWTISSAAGYDGKKVAGIGFKGFNVSLNGTDLTIYTDRCCPQKRIYVLTWSTWTMFSAGPAPNFLQRRAGSIIKVSESSDGYEARVGEYFNFCCDSPGHNAVILLA